jgi:hypothetical protein
MDGLVLLGVVEGISLIFLIIYYSTLSNYLKRFIWGLNLKNAGDIWVLLNGAIILLSTGIGMSLVGIIIDKATKETKSWYSICPKIILTLMETEKYYSNDKNNNDNVIKTNLWTLERFVIKIWKHVEDDNWTALDKYLKRSEKIIQQAYLEVAHTLTPEVSAFLMEKCHYSL